MATSTDDGKIVRPQAEPQRTRPRILVPIFAAAAVMLCGAWSWYASRPALVWYVSPRDPATGKRFRVLVPRGWEPEPADSRPPYLVVFHPVWSGRKLPPWLSWIVPKPSPYAVEGAGVGETQPGDHAVGEYFFKTMVNGEPGVNHEVLSADRRYSAFVEYQRPERRVFNATHSAICNSLRIE